VQVFFEGLCPSCHNECFVYVGGSGLLHAHGCCWLHVYVAWGTAPAARVVTMHVFQHFVCTAASARAAKGWACWTGLRGLGESMWMPQCIH
jgi:hypothetical protein